MVLYAFRCVVLSPHIENKFKQQRVDKVHVNEFIYTSFGPNAERRHGNLKAFFVTQYPVIYPPKRSILQNWELFQMLTWMK